jgi:exosortase
MSVSGLPLSELRRRGSFATLLSGESEGIQGGIRRFFPLVVTSIAFVALFGEPMVLLARDWWNVPEAGHGLLLAPVALWLAWRSGVRADSTPNHALGVAMLLTAVVIRYVSGLAAEQFTMRESMVLGLAALTVYQFGFRQVLHWWLPFTLIALSVPLPELVIQALALPLQFKASQMGAALMESRHVPVLLSGNVIRIPGHELFVTEACSGLRSLTALLSLAVLMGALMLRYPASRVLLIALSIPIAIAINGVRVFLTGFLVYFVSPSLGDGFMHITEGWLLFLVSLTVLGFITWTLGVGERQLLRWRSRDAQA